MVANLFDGEKMRATFRVFSNISLGIVAQNVLVIATMIVAYVSFVTLAPCLKWSWFSLFSKRDQETGKKEPCEGRNIHLIPAQIKYFGLVFLALLAINLPQFALTEEEWFRAGTVSWVHGVALSFLFGMVHCIVGVPLGAGIAITIAGLWFTHQYFVGGVELSTLHHTTYNLTLVSILFLGLLCEHIYSFVKDRKNEDKTSKDED